MFSRSASHVKTVSEWKALAPRGSWQNAARAYARENMVAVVMMADDSAVSFLYDVANDRIAKRVDRHVTWH